MTSAEPTNSGHTAAATAARGVAWENLNWQLRQAPWTFHFYQAARRIECVRDELPRIGASQKPGEDAVRFCQEASLAFASSTIDNYTPATSEGPPRLAVNFLGLLGPNGPMPLHITEFVRDRKLNQADPTLSRFLDLFNHRIVSLFYRAWATNQQTVSFDRRLAADERDRFAAYIGSLFGIGMDSFLERDAIDDAAKLHYSGHLVNVTRHAEGLCSIIADYFGLPAEIIQFVGQWVDLPPDSRLKLGASRETGLLGSTAIVGSKIWLCQYKFRIRLGPMTFAQYGRMLPGTRNLQRLAAWVRNYAGDALSFDAQLVLKKEEVPECHMGRAEGGGGRLGWSTWLKSQPTPQDAEDLILTP